MAEIKYFYNKIFLLKNSFCLSRIQLLLLECSPVLKNSANEDRIHSVNDNLFDL